MNLDRLQQKDKKKTYSFFLNENIEKEFSELAKKIGFSKSKFVELTMQDFIQQYKEDNES